MSTLKAEDGDASERELLVDDIQRIREVLHISGGANKLSSDEEGDEESEEEEEEEDEREKCGESLIGSTSNNSQHQIASHLSPPNSKITIPGTVLRAGDVEEQSPLNTRQEHASAPAGNNAEQQHPDVVLLQQQADNNFLPPSNMSSDDCTLTELQPVNCQPSTSVFSPGIPIASMSSLNVLNSVTNVTFISDPSTISVGYNNTTWLTEADQYCGQNDVDEQGEEGGLFSEGDDENYEDIETRSQIQQCLSKNRDYQLAVLDELGRLELALAKNREKKLGLHQMRASKDEGRPEPHTLIKFGNPYFKDTGAVGPPDNIDSKLKRQSCQVGGYQSKQKSWNAKEKACLADGVKMQNLENKLSPVLQKIQKLELNKNKTNIDCQELEVLKTESSRIKNIPKEKLAYDLEGIDWDRISNTYVPKRAGFQCRLQWCNFGHPDVNCTPWTKDEDKKLIQLAKNPQNTWVTIAQNLQTKRTPIHCYERYQRSLNKDLLKSKWTPEDDQLLLEVVRDVGLGNWPRVASFLEGRQGDQCMHRYTQTLQMVRKGKWTTDEDELLKKGIEKYGTAWNKVSDMVPGRSGPQCRERWVNALDPKIDKGVWTKGQDKNLLDNVEKFGKGNWSKIARAMGNRTDNQCWRRWIVLRKDDFLYYRQNTLRKKRELVSNFTGRRQERPSLEPEDLDIPDVPVVKKQRGRVPLPPEVSRERRRLTRKKFREKKRAEKRRAEEEARENTSREKQQVQRNETNENGEEELEGVEDGDKETVEEVKSPQNRKVRGNRTRVQQPHRVLINNKQLPKRQRVAEKQDKRHTEPAGGQKTVTVSGSLGPFSLLLQAFSIDIPTVLRAIQTTSTTSSTTPPSSGTNVIPGDQQQMQTSSATGNQESQQTSSTTPPSSGTNAILGDQQQMQTSSAAENEEIPQTSSTTPPSSGTNVTPGDQQQVQTSGATGNQESPQTSSITLPSSGTNVTPGDQQQMQTSSAAGNQESPQTSSTTPPSSGTNVTPGDQQQMQTSSAAGNQDSQQTSYTTPVSSGTNIIPEDQQQMQTSSAAETPESQQMQTEVSGDSAASQSSVNTEAGARDDTSESQEKQERAKASSGQDSQLLKEKVDESGGDQVTKHKNTGQTVGLQSRSEVNNSETLNTSRVEAGNKSTAGTPTSVAASTTNQAPRRRATTIPPLPPCFTTLRTFKSLLQLRPQLQRIAAMLNPTPCCSTAGSQSHQSLSAACPVVSSGSLSNKMSGVTCEPRDESRDSNVASRKDSEAMNKSRDNETTLGEYHVVSPGYTRDIQPCTVVEAGKENENVITDNRLSTAGTQLAEQGLPITNDKTGPEQAKATEATLSSTISSAQDGGVTDDRFSTGFAPMPKEGLQVPANDKTGPWKAKPSEPAGSVSVGNDKQAATKTNRERDTNSPSTSVANNSRVPPAVKETRSYRNSYEYKMLSSRFSGLFLWPALLSKIPVKFTSQIGPVFVQRHPPPTTRPAPEVTEKNATRKRKNTKPIEAPRPKRKHPGLAAVRMATSASSATPAQQMCTVGQGSAIRKEAAVAAAQPDADPLLATSQLVSLSTSSTGKRRYNTRASKRKGVPAKRRIKVIESSSSSSEDDWSEVYGRQRREPIITQTARITRQTSAVKPTKVSRAISAKLTSTTATDQVGANQVVSLSVIVISSDSTNESRPSLQDAQDDTAGLQSGAAANLNLSPKRSSNSNRSSKRKNSTPKKNRGARWRAMLPKVSADETDSY